MLLTRVLFKRAKTKDILVLLESRVSGHTCFRIRQRTADKMESIIYDPIVPGVKSPPLDKLKEIGRDMLSSFLSCGVVYITNYAISKTYEEDMYREGREFFNLPTQTKNRVERFSSAGANGYTPLSGEKPFYYGDLADYKECYDVRDLQEVAGDDPMPSFTSQMKKFANSCRELADRLLLALDLAMEAGGQLQQLHDQMLTAEGCTELRMIYYPPVPDSVDDNIVRCAAHTDYGTFTFLFQDDIGGLERKTATGDYVAIESRPDALAVITGDMLEVFSGGQIRAAKHRVVIPAAERLRRTHRQSMVFFVHPDDCAVVTPRGPESGYQPVTGGDLLRSRFDVIYPKTFKQWYSQRTAGATIDIHS